MVLFCNNTIKRFCMKRIVTIQDISCLGKCSLTVALPIISAMGIETSVIPTAVLSAHTIFEGHTFKDLTDQIDPIANHWNNEGFDFDAVYTGYLASKEQISIVSGFIDKFKTDNNFIFVDPAMADQGKLYPSFDSDFPEYMKKLCSKADVISPNLTEACIMTGTAMKEKYNKSYIDEITRKLLDIGCKSIILTGVELDGKYGIYSYDNGNENYYVHEKFNKTFYGTGDVFSSACVGALTKGYELSKAVEIAGKFTYESIKASVNDPERRDYGINFETALPELINNMNR